MSQKYDEYLTEHISNVKTCYKLLTGKKLESHDQSKYVAGIYEAYDIHFYGEPTAEDNDRYDYAWLLHQNKEPHHWQYWVLLKDSGTIKPLKMPRKYVEEMVSDWAAFSLKKRRPDELQIWYDTNKGNMKLHPETRSLVEELIPVMEERLAKYLKKSQ